jgi:hypothetical protein
MRAESNGVMRARTGAAMEQEVTEANFVCRVDEICSSRMKSWAPAHIAVDEEKTVPFFFCGASMVAVLPRGV